MSGKSEWIVGDFSTLKITDWNFIHNSDPSGKSACLAGTATEKSVTTGNGKGRGPELE